MTTSAQGHEALLLKRIQSPEIQDLYKRLHDAKARLFQAPETERGPLRDEVGRLTQEIRRKLREAPCTDSRITQADA